MKIYLRDISRKMVLSWEKAFAAAEDVTVTTGDIFSLNQKVDAIVSPANSFGFMDGGIDFIYTSYFGEQLQQRLQEVLANEHYGELPVGRAVVVATGNERIPWLISAPTMRVPMEVANTANAYLAFRAALTAATENPQIQTVLCPGLASAIGGMPSDRVAYQMRKAYDDFLDDKRGHATIQHAAVHHWDLVGLKLEFPDNPD